MWLSGVVGLSLIQDHYLFLVRTGFINRSVLLTNIFHQLHYRIIPLLQLKEAEASGKNQKKQVDEDRGFFHSNERAMN